MTAAEVIAKALLGAGMNVAIADIRDDHLAAGAAELADVAGGATGGGALTNVPSRP